MVGGHAPSGSGVACCPIAKITVDLVKLEFLDDHGLLKKAWKGPDGEREWRDTGTLYVHPDWEAGSGRNPISYSMVKTMDSDLRNPVGGDLAKKPNRERMKVKIYLNVGGGAACPSRCKIWARFTNSKGKRITMFRSGWMPLKASNALREIEMDCRYVVPLKIMRSKLKLDWYIRSSKKCTNPAYPKATKLATTSNTRFMTFHEPVLKGTRESGVTFSRMSRSVYWVGAAKTNDHRKIINHLFGKFDAYTLATPKPKAGGYELGYSNLSRADRDTLKSDPALLKRLGDLGWSGYFKAPGAWPAADPKLVKWGAECQAICRLAIGMLHQLGSNADIEVIYAWADFSDPNTAVVKSDQDLNAGGISAEPTGPDSSKGYVMVDTKVEVGKLYLPLVLDPGDGRLKTPPGPDYRNSNSVGWNNFEAYARYRYKTLKGSARERFYGGGLEGEHDGNMVHVFEGIAEYEGRARTVWGQRVTGRYITGYYDYDNQRYM